MNFLIFLFFFILFWILVGFVSFKFLSNCAKNTEKDTKPLTKKIEPHWSTLPDFIGPLTDCKLFDYESPAGFYVIAKTPLSEQVIRIFDVSISLSDIKGTLLKSGYKVI